MGKEYHSTWNKVYPRDSSWKVKEEISWSSSGWGSSLPLQGAQVQSQVWELRFPHAAITKKKEKKHLSYENKSLINKMAYFYVGSWYMLKLSSVVKYTEKGVT